MIRKTPLVLLAAALAAGAVVLAQDLVQLHASPGEYEQVYGFSGVEERWSHRSVFNYSLASVALVGFLLVGVVLALSQLRSRGLANQKVLYVYLVALVALVARGLFIWWRSGFDH